MADPFPSSNPATDRKASPQENRDEGLPPAAAWYVVKTNPAGHCDLVPADRLPADLAPGDRWGPFPTRNEAIARRVGLIRAGKCQPR